MNAKRILMTIGCLLVTWGVAPAPVNAQDFEAIERRLGEIIADGELTIEQASVMVHALREFTRHREHEAASHDHEHAEHHSDRHVAELLEHFRRLDINEGSVDRAERALQENGIHNEKLHHSMRTILRLVQMMRSSDKAFEMTELMQRHFREELRLSNEQITKVVGLAKRLSLQKQSDTDNREHRAEMQERMVKWMESLGERLKEAVEKGELSEADAWEKWEWIKGNQIGPKMEAAVEKGDLSREQAEAIWKSIEQAEADIRSYGVSQSTIRSPGIF